MKNNKFFLMTAILAGVFFNSCSDDDDMTDEVLGAYDNGLLVLHEGNFGSGNASVSFVAEGLDMVTNGIFSAINDRPLGDVAQSMAFDGNLAYITVNNSQTVEVVDRYSFEAAGTVSTGLLNPRYMAFANGKGYVTNWGDGLDPNDDYVAVIDLGGLTVESTIPVPEGPEWILANGNTLYVAHKGGFSQNNIVSVIDAATNSIQATITVGDSPNSMQLANGDLWVLSGGKPSWTGDETAGQLDRINTSTNTVETSFVFGATDHPDYLSIGDSTLYYLLGGNVFAMDTAGTALPESSIISNVSFYDMTVNGGRLYGVDAKDFASNGSLEVYDLSTNTSLTSLEVSLVPGGVYFNY